MTREDYEKIEKEYNSKLSELKNNIKNIDIYSILRSSGYVTDDQAIELEIIIKERINNESISDNI